MADDFYKPAEASASPEKRKPGRPPGAATKAAAASAIEVKPGVTAPAELTAVPPQEAETLEQAIARIRSIRKPFDGAMTQKLALPVRAGYHRHWFNDVAGRIDEAVASGWAHVINPRDGKPYKRVVGSGRDGKALEAYAMEIPNVFWQEEMDARHEIAKAKVDSIKKRPAVAQPGQAQASDSGKFYSPHDSRGIDPVQVTKG